MINLFRTPAKLLLTLVVGLLSMSVNAQVNYTLTVSDPAHHLAEITSRFPNIAPGPFNVIMPAWRTGRYRISNFANGVRLFRAFDDQNKPLNWQKIDKNTWQIDVTQSGAVNIGYTLYANDLGGRTRHIDDSHLFLDAASGFMYHEALRDQPLSVQLTLPKGWRSISGMDKGPTAHSYRAPNYDFLVDAPIEAGIYQQHSFQADGKAYDLVIWGEGNYNVEEMLTDLKKLVPQGRAIWGDYPFDRYIFMVHATSGIRGATEHINSTIIQRDRFSFAPRKQYLQFMGTASHEFIHTWNVKAYRPKGIARYDFEQENYSPLLWVAEGSTSYFTPLLLVRAGIMTVEEYLKQLATDIERYQNRPGNDIMSAAHSSFDTWIEQGADFTNNFSVNIYSQGAMLSLLIDLKLRELTNGVKGYQDVHQLLYQRFRLPEKGYSETDLINLLTEVSGTNFQPFWQNYVQGTKAIDFKKLLDKVGLDLSYDSKKDQGDKKTKAYLGLEYADDNDNPNHIKLTGVVRNGPAWNSGLTPDDKIVAINYTQVTPENFEQHLAMLKPGETIDVAYFRRDQLKHSRLSVGEKPSGDLKLSPIKTPSAKQRELYQAWLGVDICADSDQKATLKECSLNK